MKNYNLELIFKNTIIINYYQKERSRDLFSIKREMDEKTDIHFILRLIDEYKNKVEDEYYFDMEEKQGEENERNKVWFLNYGSMKMMMKRKMLMMLMMMMMMMMIMMMFTNSVLILIN